MRRDNHYDRAPHSDRPIAGLGDLLLPAPFLGRPSARTPPACEPQHHFHRQHRCRWKVNINSTPLSARPIGRGASRSSRTPGPRSRPSSKPVRHYRGRLLHPASCRRMRASQRKGRHMSPAHSTPCRECPEHQHWTFLTAREQQLPHSLRTADPNPTFSFASFHSTTARPSLTPAYSRCVHRGGRLARRPRVGTSVTPRWAITHGLSPELIERQKVWESSASCV